ncbi:DUF6471 domain-containing protein [Mesorhizobium yinganensis]|uniref:DUF6471 domain-containing protein n=1 Tax=Mesorhizobium yinganensis TaxID=3157707 RepID=UPI0032B6FE0E
MAFAYGHHPLRSGYAGPERYHPLTGLSGHRSGASQENLAVISVDEKEVNVRNKLSRGKFKAAFLLQCLTTIGSQQLRC